MQLSTIQKLGGVSLILGSVLLLAYSILFPLLLPMSEMLTDFTLLVLNPNWLWISLVVFIGVMMMIFGFCCCVFKIICGIGAHWTSWIHLYRDCIYLTGMQSNMGNLSVAGYCFKSDIAVSSKGFCY